MDRAPSPTVATHDTDTAAHDARQARIETKGVLQTSCIAALRDDIEGGEDVHALHKHVEHARADGACACT
jgi:hypothetical protein